MKMSDHEMEEWRKAWSNNEETSAVPNEGDVISAIRRHRVRSGLNLAGNLAFGLLLIIGSLLVARHTHTREIILWAVAVWMATLVALYLALEGWRKERIAPIETVADYAAFYRRRALADEWKARTGATLLVVLFCISATWLTVDVLTHRIGHGRYVRAIVLAVAPCIVLGYGFLEMWQKAKAVLLQMSTDEREEDDSSQG
jgi:hypothetical protein